MDVHVAMVTQVPIGNLYLNYTAGGNLLHRHTLSHPRSLVEKYYR